MKEIIKQRIRVIATKDPDQFQNEVNDLIDGLADLKPTLDIDIKSDVYKAIIRYEESHEKPETAREELHAQGLSFTCENCPKFEPERNNDGTVRQSSKLGSCFLETRTRRDCPACEWFCKQLLKGDIKVNKEGLR